MDWGSVCIIFGGKNGAASLSCLPVAFINFITALLMFAGTIAVVMIIVAGIRMMLASGEVKKLETARDTLMYAIIGLIIIFFSFFIVNIIGSVTGVRCITIPGPWAPNNCRQ